MGKKILVVEGDEATAALLVRGLEGGGFDAAILRAPAAVADMLDEVRPALVLVGADASGERARAACTEIREHPAGAIVPIILVGDGAPGDAIRNPSEAEALGADDFFRRPVDVPRLLARIRGFTGTPEPPVRAEVAKPTPPPRVDAPPPPPPRVEVARPTPPPPPEPRVEAPRPPEESAPPRVPPLAGLSPKLAELLPELQALAGSKLAKRAPEPSEPPAPARVAEEEVPATPLLEWLPRVGPDLDVTTRSEPPAPLVEAPKPPAPHAAPPPPEAELESEPEPPAAPPPSPPPSEPAPPPSEAELETEPEMLAEPPPPPEPPPARAEAAPPPPPGLPAMRAVGAPSVPAPAERADSADDWVVHVAHAPPELPSAPEVPADEAAAEAAARAAAAEALEEATTHEAALYAATRAAEEERERRRAARDREGSAPPSLPPLGPVTRSDIEASGAAAAAAFVADALAQIEADGDLAQSVAAAADAFVADAIAEIELDTADLPSILDRPPEPTTPREPPAAPPERPRTNLELETEAPMPVRVGHRPSDRARPRLPRASDKPPPEPAEERPTPPAPPPRPRAPTRPPPRGAGLRVLRDRRARPAAPHLTATATGPAARPPAPPVAATAPAPAADEEPVELQRAAARARGIAKDVGDILRLLAWIDAEGLSGELYTKDRLLFARGLPCQTTGPGEPRKLLDQLLEAGVLDARAVLRLAQTSTKQSPSELAEDLVERQRLPRTVVRSALDRVTDRALAKLLGYAGDWSFAFDAGDPELTSPFASEEDLFERLAELLPEVHPTDRLVAALGGETAHLRLVRPPARTGPPVEQRLLALLDGTLGFASAQRLSGVPLPRAAAYVLVLIARGLVLTGEAAAEVTPSPARYPALEVTPIELPPEIGAAPVIPMWNEPDTNPTLEPIARATVPAPEPAKAPSAPAIPITRSAPPREPSTVETPKVRAPPTELPRITSAPPPRAIEPPTPPSSPAIERPRLEPVSLEAQLPWFRSSDYFAILGVGPSAGADEVERAYRKLRGNLGLDRGVTGPAAREIADTLEAAYRVLKTPALRAAYLQHLPNSS